MASSANTAPLSWLNPLDLATHARDKLIETLLNSYLGDFLKDLNKENSRLVYTREKLFCTVLS